MLQLISCILDRVVTTKFLSVIMGQPVTPKLEVKIEAIMNYDNNAMNHDNDNDAMHHDNDNDAMI